MIYFISKIVISAVLIALISELSKRNSLLGAILASVPLVSVLAMIWLYYDTQNPQEVAMLAKNIFWLVLPSLVLFLALPILLSYQINFYLSLTFSLIIMIACYGLMILLLKKFGITLL